LTGARKSVLAGRADEGERLDVFLSTHAAVSRSRAQRLIAEGLAFLDGAPARKNHHVSAGEEISWEIPEPEPEEIVPQDAELGIAYEDEDIIVVDKPAEMVMYPGPGHSGGTLLNALLARYPDIAGVGGKGRPGVFHRLDRGTSGLVAIARSQSAYDAMVAEMRDRQVSRVYEALVVGSMAADTGTIDAPMARSRGNRKRMAVDRVAGRRAVSRFKVLERFATEFTLLEVTLETGRTHQIRVHFAHVGHPVAGDPEYSRGRSGKQLGLERQFLHARRLSFEHPVTGERIALESELPEDLRVVLERLRLGR
jgi:23S rRNA pseudouridine1911/1915/1917 synthase